MAYRPDSDCWDDYIGRHIPRQSMSSISPRDEYLCNRYRQLENMAQYLARGRDTAQIIIALATIDVVEQLKALPSQMPVAKMEHTTDIRVITDHINSAMSEIYK